MIKSICFLATYQCNAQCSHCECGPYEYERLSLDDMRRLIDEGVALGTVGQIVFSGGEPTLLGEDLMEGIRYAAGHGLLTRVVTNGWWGKSAEAAHDYVRRLREAGLTEINLSVDDLHQEYIKLSRVVHAFRACYEQRLPCLIAHKQNRDAVITPELLAREFGVELISYFPGTKYTLEESCRLISSGSIIPITRDEEQADEAQMLSSRWTGSCSAVLRDIIVGAKGNFLPCCGIIQKDLPELTRHNLHQHSLIDAIDDANRDVVLNWLALDGPAALADFVTEKNPLIRFKERYAGICHVCHDVLTRPEARQTIAAHIDEIAERVHLHRSFLEAVRDDATLIKPYSRC